MRLLMNWIGSLIKKYLIVCGISANLFLVVLVLLKPDLAWKAKEILLTTLGNTVPGLNEARPAPTRLYSLDQELAANFPTWQPLTSSPTQSSHGIVFSKDHPSLQAAVDNLKEGQVLRISAGIYNQSMLIRANNIIIEGEGHVVLERAVAEGKGAIVNKGDFNQIRNIECRLISVPEGNGACVRHEGQDIELNHVYFHDSEQGILAGGRGRRGVIEIKNSRFERLGNRGQAHAIYVSGDLLSVKNSLVVASKSEGHEIKSRAKTTLIDQSVIASFSSTDSRLIDIPNGGVLSITRSILQQGPESSNQDVIGYGLEGIKYTDNQIKMTDNVILMEREGGNLLLHLKDKQASLHIQNNAIIAPHQSKLEGENYFFKSRKEAGIGKYPAVPPMNDD